MKEDYEIVAEPREDVDEPRSVREIIGRMRWDNERQMGVKMSDGGNMTLAQNIDNDWVEDTEKKRFCRWWSVDNPHPFNDGKTCPLCGAERIVR